jgi:16S rRNA (guanine966-N2)-methyltransferase
MSELRIVAGAWRGRRIAVPKGSVRPTADRVREAWMSIVNPWLDGARVVDLCAGSGALGLEALSRGASHCDFVEQDPKVLTTLRANIANLGAGALGVVHRAGALKFVDEAMPAGADAPWDVAFADPPYGKGIATALAERWLRAPFAAIFGVEHETGLTLPGAGDGTIAGATVDRRQYGDTALTLFRTER